MTAREVEQLFCLALLGEGTDTTDRVLKRFIDYRERKDEVLTNLCQMNEGE